jgi:hypothetical protein
MRFLQSVSLVTALAVLSLGGPAAADAPKKESAAKAAPTKDVPADKTDPTKQKLVSKDFVYKKTRHSDMELKVFYPPDWKETDRRPAVVLFNMYKFQYQAHYLATRGMVGMAASFRDTSSVYDRLENARDAMRWIRKHHAELGVDPHKIAAGGGSASAHISACLGIAIGQSHKPGTISAVPDALILFNPILVVRDDKEAKKRIGPLGKAQAKEISPLLHLTKDVPPSLVLFGTNDRFMKDGEDWVKQCKALGVRSDLYLAKGQTHSFFNYHPWKERTLYRVDEFFESLGWVKGPPTLKLP